MSEPDLAKFVRLTRQGPRFFKALESAREQARHRPQIDPTIVARPGAPLPFNLWRVFGCGACIAFSLWLALALIHQPAP